MTAHAEPVGGPVLSKGTVALLLLGILGVALVVWRFMVGLGASTALSDGYPWGIWIAFDVVTGTALACGGYSMALLVYILNKGRYHPLVRPAILTSALGYSLAAIAIVIDVGRPWLIWRIPISVTKWNLDSALLEVALCVMAYVVVLWIELSPAFLEKWASTPGHALGGFARTVKDRLDKILLWIIALGVLLPTMHQSSLGTVILLAGPRLHPLWHSAWVPLLFLTSCLAMGWAAVVLEASLASSVFGRKRETEMLSNLARPMSLFVLGFLVLRFVDLAVKGRLGLALEPTIFATMFWIEAALFLVGLVLCWRHGRSGRLGGLFRAAMAIAAAGALYRFDIYLVAFQPGAPWTYFPSVSEILITVGLVALEILVYLFMVRRFPILAGHRSE